MLVGARSVSTPLSEDPLSEDTELRFEELVDSTEARFNFSSSGTLNAVFKISMLNLLSFFSFWLAFLLDWGMHWFTTIDFSVTKESFLVL